MSYRYDLETIISNFEQWMKSDSMITGLYQSSENLCAILSAILKTSGVKWADHIDEFTPAEKKQYTDLFHPYIPAIRSFFGQMKGGADPGEPEVETVPGANATMPNLSSTTKQKPNAQEIEIPTTDELVEKVMNTLNGINQTVYGIVREKGIIKMQTEADEDKLSDVHPLVPIAPAVATLLTPVIPPGSQPTIIKALSDVAVPQRLLFILIYLFLDITRIGAAAAGKESSRKFLSFAVAILDFLQGDWKKAIMTFAGYFGSNYAFIGQLGKIYLTLFQTLSPRIQDNFIYGSVNAVKSFFIGALFTIFKLVATYDVREPVIQIMKTISNHKRAVDSVLQGEGYKPLPDYMDTSYDKLSDLQGVMDDPAFICSTEYETLLEKRSKSKLLDIILTLFGIPLTPGFEDFVCESGRKPFIDLIKERQQKKKNRGTTSNLAISQANAPAINPTAPEVVIPKVVREIVDNPSKIVANASNVVVPGAPAAPGAEAEAPLPPVIGEPAALPVVLGAPKPSSGGKRRLRRSFKARE